MLDFYVVDLRCGYVLLPRNLFGRIHLNLPLLNGPLGGAKDAENTGVNMNICSLFILVNWNLYENTNTGDIDYVSFVSHVFLNGHNS